MAFGSGLTAGGNCDVGIYDDQGNRLVSSGATARTASAETICNITDTFLAPGIYYIAMSHDGTSNIAMVLGTVQRSRWWGVVEMAAAYVLPATATFAAASTATSVPAVAIYGAAY